MKVATALLATAVAVTAADHHHAHQHLHKRNTPSPVNDVVVVPGPTVLAYVLDGQAISAQEVQEGIANGTLRLEKNGALQQVSSATTVSLTSSIPSSTSSSSTSSWSSTSSSSSSSASPSPSSYTNTNINSEAFNGGGSGVDTPFPSGQVDCSTFPSEYGAVLRPMDGSRRLDRRAESWTDSSHRLLRHHDRRLRPMQRRQLLQRRLLLLLRLPTGVPKGAMADPARRNRPISRRRAVQERQNSNSRTRISPKRSASPAPRK